MSAFTIYRRDTGQIVGVFSGSDRHLDANVPEGCAAVPGRYDGQSQRIDPETEQAVDWQPPQPSADYEWVGRRWVPNSEALRKRVALREIRRLERDEQPRAVREAVLGLGRERLEQIQDRIEELRAVISTAGRPGQT